jgi:hypothetical protein
VFTIENILCSSIITHNTGDKYTKRIPHCKEKRQDIPIHVYIHGITEGVLALACEKKKEKSE